MEINKYQSNIEKTEIGLNHLDSLEKSKQSYLDNYLGYMDRP